MLCSAYLCTAKDYNFKLNISGTTSTGSTLALSTILSLSSTATTLIHIWFVPLISHTVINQLETYTALLFTNIQLFSYRIHRKFAPFFAQIFAKKFVKCKNLHKKLRKHLRHDYFLAFICANICTNFWVSKIFAQIFAQLFAQIFRLKNIRANFCAIICSNFWVKTNLRKFFFANICVKFLATY